MDNNDFSKEMYEYVENNDADMEQIKYAAELFGNNEKNMDRKYFKAYLGLMEPEYWNIEIKNIKKSYIKSLKNTVVNGKSIDLLSPVLLDKNAINDMIKIIQSKKSDIRGYHGWMSPSINFIRENGIIRNTTPHIQMEFYTDVFSLFVDNIDEDGEKIDTDLTFFNLSKDRHRDSYEMIKKRVYGSEEFKRFYSITKGLSKLFKEDYKKQRGNCQ